MAVLSQASAALNDLKDRVIVSSDATELSDDERRDAEIAKAEANETIDVIKKMIATALGKHRESHKTSKKPVDADQLATASNNPDKDFKDATMTNLDTVAKTADKMSGSIENIVNNFNTILGLSGLEKFSGTLESVPAVGIFNNTVQYVGLSLDKKDQVQPQWSVLDELPAALGDGDIANLFSYQGSFFVSIGKKIWEKPTKNPSDPTLYKAATDNWANMYQKGWQFKGDCLPANDIKDVIPWAELSQSGNTLTTALCVLKDDGTLALSTSAIGSNMVFNTLKLASGEAGPVLVNSAYWDNAIWGVDAQNVLYQIVPSIGDSTYTIKDQNTLSGVITDMTAVDTGLIVAKEDGNLYQLITYPPKDNKSPPTQTWQLWISAVGVASLGAAAPGIILNLKTVTQALKNSYVDTQVNLFPIVNLILAFCKSHKVYLGNLMEASTEWRATKDPTRKAQIASGEGQLAVDHAQALGGLLYTNLLSANTMVVNMTNQTSQIDSSLAAQLEQIDRDIDALKESINEAEESYKQLTAGLWASIAAVVLGIGLAVAGFFFPPAAPFLWLAAGALVLGGIVAVGVISSERAKLTSAINSMKRELANLTESKEQLIKIRAAFTDLTSDYEELTAFWFDMVSVSEQIVDLDSLGIELLRLPSSITAAELSTDDITKSFKNYIQILGRQGIKPRSSEDMLKNNNFLAEPIHQQLESFQQNLKFQKLDQDEQVQVKLAGVHQLMTAATERLASKDYASYRAIMSNVVRLNTHIHKPFIALC